MYKRKHRELVEITKTDFTDVAAIVLTSGDVGEYLERIQAVSYTHLDVYKRQK